MNAQMMAGRKNSKCWVRNSSLSRVLKDIGLNSAEVFERNRDGVEVFAHSHESRQMRGREDGYSLDATYKMRLVELVQSCDELRAIPRYDLTLCQDRSPDRNTA